MTRVCGSFMVIVSALSTLALPLSAQEPRQITMLYDAFGAESSLVKDWGFAALIEYGGKRILFDTGNNGETFEHNVNELGVDLKRLDAVVISHRHGDHTSGINYLLEVNPDVKIYAPQDGAFGRSSLPPKFLESQPGLPPELRYFSGQVPEGISLGTPWETGNFEIVTQTTEIIPGFFVVTTRSEKPGTLEMNEVSLAIRTPKGLAVVVGCSHPGVEKILGEAAKIDPQLFTVTGGFHLVLTPREEIERVASELDDSLNIERVAPGHCTSELGFTVLMDRFKDRFDRAGLGAVILLP